MILIDTQNPHLENIFISKLGEVFAEKVANCTISTKVIYVIWSKLMMDMKGDILNFA